MATQLQLSSAQTWMARYLTAVTAGACILASLAPPFSHTLLLLLFGDRWADPAAAAAVGASLFDQAAFAVHGALDAAISSRLPASGVSLAATDIVLGTFRLLVLPRAARCRGASAVFLVSTACTAFRCAMLVHLAPTRELKAVLVRVAGATAPIAFLSVASGACLRRLSSGFSTAESFSWGDVSALGPAMSLVGAAAGAMVALLWHRWRTLDSAAAGKKSE
eukprot:gnl/Ergobibamus_cyprinoides/1290.p1 GENE.gnl/Ergobibamus_cyprinoides/1290~~gnl/Ergobibamus_cyprinoides/1290.p1  ORF type:complete len:221 (-),score=39.66 gnl/Ergobibamus_cyprinoides/1290:34-696(-)